MDQRAKLLKIQKKTVGKLHDIGVGNDFLDATPKAWATKQKIDKIGLQQNVKLLCIKK